MKGYIKKILREELEGVVVPPPIVLHLGNSKNRELILEMGLIPQQITWGNAMGSDYNKELGDKGAIFVTTNGKPYDNGYDYDVWEIDTTKINNRWFEDEYMDNSIYTLEPISKDAIKLTYQGNGDDLWGI